MLGSEVTGHRREHRAGTASTLALWPRTDKRHESVTRGDRRARTPGPAPRLGAAAATPRSRRESFKQLFMRLFPRSGRNEHSPAL